MKECTEDKCMVCDSYGNLISLLAEGLTLEDAFVDVMQDVLMNASDNSFNKGYELGYSEGYKDGITYGLESIKLVAEDGIKQVQCEICDCEDGECKY